MSITETIQNVKKHGHDPKHFCYLSSVFCYLDKSTGNTYPHYKDGEIYLNRPVHLSEIEIGDWFGDLSNEDWQQIQIAFPNLSGYTQKQMQAFTDNDLHDVSIRQLRPRKEVNDKRYGNYLYGVLNTTTGCQRQYRNGYLPTSSKFMFYLLDK